MLHVALLVGSALLMYLACEWFVSAVEWLGRRLKVGPVAVGTVLAAIGTALPRAWSRGLPGTLQRSEYPNEQRATSLWYHDHAMGIISLNVMTGLMGMYLIRDADEDALRLPHGKREVPLFISDRNLDTDAQGNLTSQLLYKIILRQDGIRIPFFGPFTLVNRVIWPHLEVDACWYRFRLLNASNQRAYDLVLSDQDGAEVAGALHQIGTDGGLLPEPVALDDLTLAPAERADILIDFSTFRAKSLVLANRLAPVIPGIPTTPNPRRHAVSGAFRTRR